jgi:predicted metal-dependent phosphoesterase TrpH
MDNMTDRPGNPSHTDRPMSIDLHTHSTASDGTLSPTELIRLAKDIGLDAIALTDHDTISGLDEAEEAGRELGIEVIRGCELSLESPRGAGWMHVVALWVPPHPEELTAAFDWVIEGRLTRNHEIVKKLRSQGIGITYEAVAARAGGTIGRPHFAQELLSLGVVSNMDEAFKVWLGDNGRAYVPKRKLKPEQALGILKRAGATSILAHPFILGLDEQGTEGLVRELQGYGLDGMEVYYPEHDDAATKIFKAMAERLGLLISGGSDFHGSVKPRISLGRGKGGLHVATELLDAMKADRRAKGLPV